MLFIKIAILDSSGEIVVEYSYDAWGNHTIKAYNKTIANANPFRYRSYFYDTDTGLYYLKTRYYDPEVGRFLNMDAVDNADPLTLGGLNLYSYCNNNPVMYVDPTGEFIISSFLIGIAIGAAIGAAVGGVSYVISEAISYAVTGEWSWSWGMFAGSVLGCAIGGALSFAIPGLGIMGSAAVTGAISTSIGMGLENAFGEANHSIGEIFLFSTISAGLSAVFAGLTSLIKFPGFTGRGSISQVARQINTKLFNGTIGKIGAKTFFKMAAYVGFYSIFNTIGNGIIDIWQYNNYVKNNSYPAIIPF